MFHQNAAKRILRYVKGTLEFGLVYTKKSGNNLLTGYSDSDMGGNIDDRKSTGGMVFLPKWELNNLDFSEATVRDLIDV